MSDFLATSGPISGSASAQNLLSIENPTGNTKNVFLKLVNVHGTLVVLSTVVFSYRASRTSAMPSSGSTVTAFRTISGEAPSAVIRTAPTASASGGDLGAMNPGVILGIALSGGFVPNLLPLFDGEHATVDAINIAPGEAVLVRAEANATNWTHYVNIVWSEEDV